MQKFTGHKQSKYVLKWSFGGKYENYIVWGSEDDKIYIWNRSNGELLDKIEGHTDTVNNIAWNNNIPDFMFSWSDDQSIKIWGSHQDFKVKVIIESKFKHKDDEIMSGNNSDDNYHNQEDSDSIGDSSISENSIPSLDEEE